jgi:hypothetical protein
MAEKKIIEIEVKTQQAVQSMDALSKSTKEAGKEFDKAATFAERYGEELQPLTSRMGEAEDRLYELANAGQTTTQEYKDLLKTVGEFRKVQINTDMAVDAAATTMGQKLGGALGGVTAGFSVAQGAFAAFGGQSEEIEKALLKVQAAMAIQQGVQGIREAIPSFKALGAAIKATSIYQAAYNFIQTGSAEATTEATAAKVADAQATVAQGTATVATTAATTGASVALKLLRAALISTGVGALVVGLGMLIANLDSIIGFFTGSTNANLKNEASIKKNTAALNAQIKANERSSTALKTKNGHEYKMAEASGASANALHKLAIRHANEEIALERASKATAHNTYVKEKNTLAYYRSIDASDEVIEKQKKLTQAAMENSIKEGKDLAAALENKAALLRDNEVRIASEKHSRSEKSNERTTKTEKAHNERTVKNQKAQAKEIIDISKQIEDEKLRLQDESLAKEISALKLKYERKKEEEEKQRKAGTLTKKSFEALQIQATESFEYDKSQIVEKYLNQESQLKTVSSRNAIQGLVDNSKTRLQIEKTTSEKSIEILQAEAEQKAVIQQQGLDIALQGIDLIKGLFEKSKGVQKAAVIAESAIGIAKMIISNKLANIAALATPQAIATSGAAAAPVIAMNNISTGIGIAANIAATAKALSTLGGGSAPSGSVGGGGATAPTMSAPQFNVVGQSGVNQLATLNQQPIQAYVVSGQVTSQQALDRNRLENATLRWIKYNK